VHRKRYQEQRNFAGWRSFLVAASLLAFPWENSSCATPSNAPAELSPIVIGVSNVQTGPASLLGQTLLQGSMAYFNLVNQKGGIRGRKVSIILKDDKYEPDLAVQNTNELIERNKVFFLFDYVGIPTLTRVLPLLRYYEKEGIVNVAPFTGADP
jgi:ABC-type branched-subunit amino acid transport system substrate-binding protein